jgi:hypothetical protein
MSTSRNFDYLPSKVLTFTGHDFYQFIKSTLGEPEANLLNKISVKSTSSFLATEDPLEIFKYDIDDDDLEKLQDQLCFKLKNDKLLIKPGVISGFRSLRDALQKRINDQSTKSKKNQQKHQSSDTNLSSLNSLPDMNLSSLNSLSDPASSIPQAKAVHKKLSLFDHKEHVLRLIKKWCFENKEHFDIQDFDLVEDVDFTLNIDFDQNNDVIANMKCKCGKLISLGKNDSKIQVSNYYKHVQSKGCLHIRSMKKVAKDLTAVEQQSSTPIVSLSSGQPRALPTEATVVSPTAGPISSHIGPSVISDQPVQNGKRRLASQSQQHSSKRSRT